MGVTRSDHLVGLHWRVPGCGAGWLRSVTALETVSAPVGVRHSHEVSDVLAVASAVPFCTERFGRGVLGALRRALGRQMAAPVTAASPEGVPPWAQLLDEAYAARTELLGP